MRMFVGVSVAVPVAAAEAVAGQLDRGQGDAGRDQDDPGDRVLGAFDEGAELEPDSDDHGSENE